MPSLRARTTSVVSSGILVLNLLAPAAASGEPKAAKGTTEPSSTTAASPEREAAKRYEEGATAFRKGNFEAAVAEFLAADLLAPSAALSYNTALAYDKLRDVPRALQFYRDYLRRRPNAANAEEVNRRVGELEMKLMGQGVQQLTIRSEPVGASLSIEGNTVGVTPWTGELTPGEHHLVVTMPGRKDQVRKVLLPAANSVDLYVELEPVVEAAQTRAPRVPPPPRPARNAETRQESGANWVPWATLGAGAAGLAAAGTFELLRRQSESEARSAVSQVQYEQRREQVDDYKTSSRILLGVGGALVVTSGVLFFMGAANDDDRAVGALGCDGDGCFGSYRARF